MEKLGNRLKRLRTTKSLKVSDVARHLGIAQSTYREWEYGRVIQGEPYLALAELFEVSLYELLTGARPKYHQVLDRIAKVEQDLSECRKILQSFICNDTRAS